MTKIYLARKLSVDAPTAATQVIAAIGMRGSGKSNAMAVLAEGMLTAGTQVIVLDYVGIWFSLRLKADGKTPDFEIPVLGGPHGDIVLPSAAGTIVARALAQTGSAAVLDLSAFSKTDRMRFATDFAEALFAEKKKYPGPCFLILEEAQRYIPQKMFAGQERMLGAFEEIAEVGRNYGLGLGLLSQRPQKLNKDVLNLTELLFAFQANGVLERKAISEWVQEKGAEGRAEVHDELPSLDVGQALVWSPRWLKIYGKFTLHKKTSYDAGATPLHARAAVKVKALDLGELETSMKDVVEIAKATDPKALQAEVARLKRELAKQAPKPQSMVVERVPKAVQATIVGASREVDYFLKQAQQLGQRLDKLRESLRSALDEGQISRATAVHTNGMTTMAAIKRPLTPVRMLSHEVFEKIEGKGRKIGGGGRGERKIAAAIAQHVDGVTREQLSVLTGYKRSSRDTYLQRLLSGGYVRATGDGRLFITDAGTDWLGPDFQPLPTGDALREHWLNVLPEGERRVLRIVIDGYPEAIVRDIISEATGYKRSSRDTYLQRLSARRLVEAAGGMVRASDTLFG